MPISQKLFLKFYLHQYVLICAEFLEKYVSKCLNFIFGAKNWFTFIDLFRNLASCSSALSNSVWNNSFAMNGAFPGSTNRFLTSSNKFNACEFWWKIEIKIIEITRIPSNIILFHAKNLHKIIWKILKLIIVITFGF